MGEDGTGRKLTEDEIMTSVKLYCHSTKKDEDYEQLAKLVNFDIEAKALQAIR